MSDARTDPGTDPEIDPHTDAASGSMTDATHQPRQFAWFLALQISWFVAFGIQAVLFPYLIVNVLNESPERVGLAQMCMMAPALLLMLPGGMLADASDLRTLMFRLQLCATLPAGVLCVVTGQGQATFAVLIIFALAHGSLQAIVVPTRDALLSRVAGKDIQRAVTTAMAVQFACQIAGFVLAGSAQRIGAPTLLGIQATLYGLGALCALQLRPVPRIEPTQPSLADRHIGAHISGQVDVGRSINTKRKKWARRWSQVRASVSELPAVGREISQSPRLAPVMVVMIGVGFFYISVFNVVVPVMVRDYYLGGSGALAMVNGSFVGGLIVATMVMRQRAAIHHQGRAIFWGSVCGVALTGVFAAEPPVLIFYANIALFGAASGVIMSLGRTIVQQSASPARRARVLALYSLGFLGAAPLGSLVVGQIAEHTNVLTAALVASIGMAALLVLVHLRANINSVVSQASDDPR